MKKPIKIAFEYKVEYDRAPVLNGILPESCAKTTKSAKEMLQKRFPTAKKITVGKFNAKKLKTNQ
jgi:hypothetical protein